MKKHSIAIKTGQGDKTIDAYLDDSFPGLAVHRKVLCFENGTYYPGDWTVTHIKTGFLVFTRTYPLRRQAAIYAQELCKSANWTVVDPLAQLKGRLYNTASRAEDAARAA